MSIIQTGVFAYFAIWKQMYGWSMGLGSLNERRGCIFFRCGGGISGWSMIQKTPIWNFITQYADGMVKVLPRELQISIVDVPSLMQKKSVGVAWRFFVYWMLSFIKCCSLTLRGLQTEHRLIECHTAHCIYYAIFAVNLSAMRTYESSYY